VIRREAKQMPWYHVPLPRCEASRKLDGVQCIFSARYEGRPHNGNGNPVELCKMHADMADFPVRLIRVKKITLRRD
jgi:hypothetical protein